MAVIPRLEQRLGQSLVMTPQLQQAIKLLQLSAQDLRDYVDQEIDRNPLLERAEADGPVAPAPPSADAPARDAPAPDPAAQDSASAAASDHLPGDNDGPLDVDLGNIYEPDGAASPATAEVWGRGGRSDFEGSSGALEDTLTNARTLRESLTGQLAEEVADPAQRLIGAALIDQIDDAGYLATPIQAVAEQLGCALDQVELVLAIVQRFEPAGLFARSLSECLALQLRERDRLDPAMQTLLDNLELVARRDVARLSALCGVDVDDVADMVREIKTLNPKPGVGFEPEVVQTLVPDVFVRKGPDGTWAVELNSDALPRVLVNRRYHAQIAEGSRDKAARSFLSEQLQSANWLIKALDQRCTTMLKVSTEIVRQQRDFLDRGVHHLRPLTLRAIAEELGMHESTISRVTANKYMATPRGVLELKYFFSSAIASRDGGEAMSSESIRHRIKDLIDAETPAQALSDDRIVDILRRSGVDIARRTVAKYREALRIPSSVERRRLRNSGA